MPSLIITFLMLIFCSAQHIQISNLKVQYWNYFWFTVPLILTAAHFHNIIPKLFSLSEIIMVLFLAVRLTIKKQ